MNRLFLKTLTALFVFSLLLSIAARAETTPPKIGLFNMQKALQTVGEAKKAQAELKKEFEAKQKQLEAEGKKIKAAMEEFQKQSMVLDDKARQEKQEAIQQQIMKAKEMEAKFTMEFQQKDQAASLPIIEKLRKIVAQVSKEKGYTLVIDGNENTVFYNDKNDDITDAVIKIYDKK